MMKRDLRTSSPHETSHETSATAVAELSHDAGEDALATIAHELRSPLQTIAGWAELLRRGTLDSGESRRAVEVIARAAEYQAVLIDDLLDRTRIRHGQLAMKWQWVDVTALVTRTAESMLPLARANGVQLDLRSGGSAPVLGDTARLEQVMRNLLGNAVRFSTSDSRIQVFVAEAMRQVRISVSDCGIGIHREFLPRVFDWFRQGNDDPRGLGVGLAVAKHIVQLHGGSISAESDGLGKGATFRVILPGACVEHDMGRDAPSADGASADGAAAEEARHGRR
jgi:signal transduction histidine kinase